MRRIRAKLGTVVVVPALAGCCLVAFGFEATAGQAAAALQAMADDEGSEGGGMRADVEDRFVVVNGIRLHYREWGTAGAPPVVILHGLTGHAWEFDGVAAALAAGGHHVVAVNQRGHGASAWADDYSPEIMADDAAAVIEALELGRVTVIGHSMGGVNGWWLAARRPELVERFVILEIDPEAITSETLYEGWTTALNAYAQARFADAEAAVAAYLEGYAGAEREALRTFALNNIEEGSDGQWAWRFDARRLSRWLHHALDAGDAHWARLRQLACPTLIVRAVNSPYTTAPAAERMAGTIPDARLVEMPDSGHDVHIDQPDALLAELRSFLGT